MTLTGLPKFCNSTSVMYIIGSNVQGQRAKHTGISYYFRKEHINIGYVELQFVPINKQLADKFTKILDVISISRLASVVGMLTYA